MTHTLTLASISNVTHDTYRLVFPRPDGYAFQSGQATEMALCKEGWTDEKRPFTFTSLPSDDHLEFVIKSYPSHDGVTEQISKLGPGDQVMIGDAWGAIEDRGAGVFLAGGAGITPFIAILRSRLLQQGNLSGYTLIFSNTAEKDIILKEEFDAMPGLETHYVLSDEDVDGMHKGRINGNLLDKVVSDYSQTFYLCGPPPMEDAVSKILKERGVSEDKIVREE
ncbi:MAG: flavodoxin reductase [Pseudomonadota bacterium]